MPTMCVTRFLLCTRMFVDDFQSLLKHLFFGDVLYVGQVFYD